MDKFLVIPFVFALAVILAVVGLFAYYGPNQGGGGSAPIHTVNTALHVQSAVFDDVTLGESAPCSAAALVVSCDTTFTANPGDSIQILVTFSDTGSPANVTYNGQTPIVTIPGEIIPLTHGQTHHTFDGVVALATAQKVQLLLNFLS